MSDLGLGLGLGVTVSRRVRMHWLSIVQRTLFVLLKLLERGGLLVADPRGFGRRLGAFRRNNTRLTERSKLV